MITVRGMKEADLEDILEMERECFATPWSRESFEMEFKNKFARYVVAEIDGKVVGYGGLWLIIDEAHITNIAVREEYRKMDVGSHILSGLVAISLKRDIKSMTLEVRASNVAAIRLYEKYDFKEAGIRPKYYSDNNEDAIIMWLNF